MALRWISVRHEGAILPQGRTQPAVYFQFINGAGGAGAFYRRVPGGASRSLQIGQVPIGDGRTSYKTATLPNTQSGLPLRVEESPTETVVDFLSIGRTPDKAQAYPTLVRTNGKYVTRAAALGANFGTVAYTQINGLDGFLFASGPTALVAHDGTAIPAGIHCYDRAAFNLAPALGYSHADNGELAAVTTKYAYPITYSDAGNTLPVVTPLYGALAKDIYYLIERDNAEVTPVYYISSFSLSTGKYTRGPALGITPLGLSYCESEEPGFLVVLGYRTLGTYDSLFRLDPATGVASHLVSIAANDPNDPAKRQGLFLLGKDPSSAVDQFVVVDSAYLGLIPEVELAADSTWFARRSLANPAAYYVVTAERGLSEKAGMPLPREPRVPTVLPGDPPPLGFPRGLFPPPPSGSRDLPTTVSKWIPYHGPFTSKTFNTWSSVLFGINGRVRGLRAIPNGNNTQVAIEVGANGGAFVCNGIMVYYPAGSVITPVGVKESTPYALTAYTADETSGSPIVFEVFNYNPAMLQGKAILATTDSSGFNWTPTPALGLDGLSEAANTKQFTDEEEALLVSRDGPIDVADVLHRHRVPIAKEAFEAIFNYDYDKVPHPPKATPPVAADNYHTHNNLMTDFEVEALTGRGGVTSADSQHTHDTLPSNAAFTAVFGGPKADASDYHTHLAMLQAHGIVANPRATKIYVPQNIGTGQGFIDATDSTFTGSLALILGEAYPGHGVDRITGIRYKENALFLFSTYTSDFGGGTGGQTTSMLTELFGPENTSGITAPIEFNTTFSWRGILLRVEVPTVGRIPFTLPSEELGRPYGDFFSFHGIVAATEDVSGLPSSSTLMEEGYLSRAAPRYALVVDERYAGGGYLTMTLS